MLYTITFNPAVDLVMSTDHVTLGELNRVQRDEYVAGGKGINMSVLLKRLGHDNIATGFLGGFTGEFIRQQLLTEGVQPEFVEVDAITRINVKLKAAEETEINAKGPVIHQADIDQLFQYFDSKLTGEDVVFLAGNTAPGMTSDHYVKIAKLCKEKGARFVLDTNKDLLTACLAYQPFLIKPNIHELAEIFNVEIQSHQEVIYYARELQQRGGRNVIISLGGDGAFLLTEHGEIYQSSVPKGQVINSVGAGDSMVAGFTAKYIESQDYIASLRQGAACGSSTAFSIGIAQLDTVNQLVDEIKITKIGV
ncbi:1-phosphofructokinase [Fundicoccus sp. Sow4_H7]|uniref:1-phosphofructokinase n=1 Tax=Fundicoccus sp. Sow4_H7 TaxID=3438784 RepID=UPI003F913C6C